jgi:hypothetical protein
MNEIKEYTLEQAKEYLRENKKTKGEFYFNVYGWSNYYTLEPTFATPTGNLKEFPRKVIISTRTTKPKAI